MDREAQPANLARRLLGRFPALRSATRSDHAQRWIRLARRLPLVERRIRFLLLETVAPAGRLGTHSLRGTDVRVCLRHRTHDLEIFDEIFGRAALYAWPSGVAAILDDARPGPRVLDLGANTGLFGAHVLREHPSASITAIEPDPANLAVLRRTIAANRAHQHWRVLAACAANEDGRAAFAAGRFGHSRVDAGAAGAIDVCAIDVVPLLEQADLVKMDIEGSEWQVLLDPRFPSSAPPALVLEWHEQGLEGGDARATALGALAGAGYEVLADPRGPYAFGMAWGWRPPAGGEPS